MLLTSSVSLVAQVILPGLLHIHLAFQMTLHLLQQHLGQHCEMVQLPENQGNQTLENCVPLEPPLEPLQLFGNLNIAFDLQDCVTYISMLVNPFLCLLTRIKFNYSRSELR